MACFFGALARKTANVIKLDAGASRRKFFVVFYAFWLKFESFFQKEGKNFGPSARNFLGGPSNFRGSIFS